MSIGRKLAMTSCKTPRRMSYARSKGGMRCHSKPSRVCMASSDNVLERSSRDIDVAMTELLLNLLESAIWARFNQRMTPKFGETRRVESRERTSCFSLSVSPQQRIATNHHSAIANKRARPTDSSLTRCSMSKRVKWTYILCCATLLGVS
jgi:hypothetical protein